MLPLTRSILLALLAFATAGFAAGPLYHVQDLGVFSTAAGQINRHGELAGTFESHAALWTGQRWKVLSPGGDANGTGDNGAVAGTVMKHHSPRAVIWRPNGQRRDLIEEAVQSHGTAMSPDGTLYGAALQSFGQEPYTFSWRKGVLTKLPPSTHTWAVPKAANNAGQLAGYAAAFFCEFCCPTRPVVFSGGVWTVLRNGLSGSCGSAQGINAAGTVVGYTYNPGLYDYYAFVYKNGVVTELGFSGAAYSINSAGDIVGGHLDTAGHPRPFLLKEGMQSPLDLDTVMDFVPEHGDSWAARSINDAGQIVIQGVEPDNVRTHVYLLTPL